MQDIFQLFDFFCKPRRSPSVSNFLVEARLSPVQQLLVFLPCTICFNNRTFVYLLFSQMGISLSGLPAFLGGTCTNPAALQAEAMAQRVPDDLIAPPPVSMFGRLHHEPNSSSSSGHASPSRLGSLREGMANITAWCTSSADT